MVDVKIRIRSEAKGYMQNAKLYTYEDKDKSKLTGPFFENDPSQLMGLNARRNVQIFPRLN